MFLLMSANANLAGTDQHVTQVQHKTCNQMCTHTAATKRVSIDMFSSHGTQTICILGLKVEIVTVAMTIQYSLH